MSCACINAGFCHKNGRQNVELAMNIIFSRRQDVRPIVEECNQDVAPAPVETFTAVLLCYREKLPFKTTFPE
ncbi:hypothetical protein O3G_MSEX014093 [Manduca sexta]|uniref:Uncharacterized protein n=1 Tax=Manduca sexta TaxID=7130 RepID=A0A922CZ67_MANSE|nr:hypothetical protein O3G_MSEX014093 [Manduca sexta]KAG6463837.1 hypothetical protein O3G_MSEX014093 [Manduca sexta]